MPSHNSTCRALRGACISLALFQILLAGALVILVADDPSGTPAWLCLPYALASVMFAAKGIYDATQVTRNAHSNASEPLHLSITL
ncbi:hypothetical protein DSO57_1031720 [Entomophthora muscae]|uniref:Uncharacterized protein n=1 Tax=Entomophthora muscae TaxID=34485 RepID=A0ACC2TNA2_9FUNG|nr:hypothetical protein DSO57_1031720 [Entomophthora muscae]